ncbi:PREDICTED: partitioning defective 3 homolog isoform X2 [Nicrophorus vespilloides]|uniref:Partitioning defective 3 homolog isoform X2 n=1 Tax=Nicrophorus vespilloides TaxID=110193 RepID=A0ABM1N693_NICVS|nr:PREDICTED: partitioning defective 3 homolog isoform X2 [Nicrophorus vespilloides]
MFDNCHTSYVGPKCSEVAEKLVQIFGWRHTYNVEKLQRNVPGRDTTRISITRPTYIKATINEKGPESWLAVHNLQSQGGGILDPDDRLSDVVDDREQILASFEDGEGAHHHGGGDGASGSSVGTGSPDIFHDGEHKYGPGYSRTDIEVTGEHLANGVGGALQVRRGSEPALNQLPVGPPAPTEHTKRWSAAPLILEPPITGYLNISTDWADDSREEEEDERPGTRGIARDGSNRLSMQFLGDGGGYKWAEAAERAANARNHTSTSLPREQKRKEPLGQANNSSSPISTLEKNDRGELIVIRNEPGPLGIHVVPDYDRQGKDRGLSVQGIEPGGRIDRDGRLAIFDRIIEINSQNLINMPFPRVQEMFKLSLTSPELRLRVIKATGIDNLMKPPPPIYPRLMEDKENIEKLVECEQKQSTNTKVATVSPTKKIPSVPKNLKSLLSANTRKIGRKIELELTKGPHGLGFSITTRDNPAGGNCPIYIKNIIPKGAAVEDGRLKIGDRLLEVNGVEMTGKSQSEAVSVLRNAPTGSKVRIVVSRQEDVPDNSLPRVIGVDPIVEKSESREDGSKEENTPPTIPPLPQNHQRQQSLDKASNVAKIISQFQEAANISTPADKSDDSLSLPWKHKDLRTFNIPVHDSEKAGLGISVKGKTSGSQDLGIFIKTVIYGGAASRDNRLRTNDQLLNVNGISLLHQSNSDAMETLRKAMCHTEGPVPGNITLTIARRAPSPGLNRSYRNRSMDSSLLNSTADTDSDPSLNDHSGGSTNTVIFNPHKSPHDSSKSSSFNQSIGSPMNTWNPVLDRLMGNNNKQLRNESYYKATNDTWNQSIYSPNISGGANIMSTTVNLPTGEPVLIEDEYGSRVMQHNRPKNHHSPNISSHLMIQKSSSQVQENRKDHEPDGKASLNDKTMDSSQNSQVVCTDVTYASQLSLENPADFCRDAFGRQSMSEKRHTTLDPKNTDTYQRTKKIREERDKIRKETNLVRVGSVESVISVNRSSEHPEYADKLGQLGPSLGMKKSSSLESLQTMVQEIQMQEEGDPAYSYRGPSGALKVIRGRGCEESFRAAVDKDYNKHIVDPNHRSEISAKKHWLLDPPVDYEKDGEGFNNVRGGPRQSSLNAAIDSKHKAAKKKPSIFKGIGSMFRFGKHRKIDFPIETQHYQSNNEFDNVDNYANKPVTTTEAEAPKNENMVQAQGGGQESAQTQPQQQQQGAHREPIYQRHGFMHHHAEQVQVIPENATIQPVRYRNNHEPSNHGRSNLMKAHEQRMARNSYYPPSSEEREPHYEQLPRQQQQTRVVAEQNGNYGEYGRPGSRSGITESVPFTHYVNYNELQTHLSRSDQLSDSQIVQMRLQVQQQRLKVEEESRKQHQYHSQRQPRQDNQLRPVSNFYEYESVQSLLNTRGRNLYQDNNNAMGRQQQQPRQHQNAKQQHHQQRGPFVTQVTIGDGSQQQQQQNGTKV